MTDPIFLNPVVNHVILKQLYCRDQLHKGIKFEFTIEGSLRFAPRGIVYTELFIFSSWIRQSIKEKKCISALYI